MNATSGAHGTRDAMAPSTMAVVPHEQNGVKAANATAPITATAVLARSAAANRSPPT